MPAEVLDSALFLFGSKRFWLFPETPEQEAESNQQPGGYNMFPSALKELIRR